MQSMMKNKKMMIAAAVVVVIALIGGIFVLASRKSSTSGTAPSTAPEQAVNTLKPEDIGLQLSARADKKAVKFVITNPNGITSVDYEISYTATGNIPRGAIGHVDLKSGDAQIQTDYIDLGTCSSGVCKYDTGVTSVDFILKITKSDGKIYQVEKSLNL